MHKMYFKVHYLASDSILYPTSMSQCHMYDFHNSTDILVNAKLHRYVLCVIAIDITATITCLISNNLVLWTGWSYANFGNNISAFRAN